jgi:hypothetical protein
MEGRLDQNVKTRCRPRQRAAVAALRWLGKTFQPWWRVGYMLTSGNG